MPPLYVIRHFISPDDIQRLSFLLWFPCRNPKRKEKKMKVPIKLAACLLAMTVMVPSGFAFADVDGEDIGGMSSGSASSIQPYANNVNTSFYFTFKKVERQALVMSPEGKITALLFMFVPQKWYVIGAVFMSICGPEVNGPMLLLARRKEQRLRKSTRIAALRLIRQRQGTWFV